MHPDIKCQDKYRTGGRSKETMTEEITSQHTDQPKDLYQYYSYKKLQQLISSNQSNSQHEEAKPAKPKIKPH